jgi:hypothetical protein
MRLFKGFGQWMEGSMMDWQIGDLYDMVVRERFRCYPLETVYSPLSCSDNLGVNVESHRGANWKRLGQNGCTAGDVRVQYTIGEASVSAFPVAPCETHTA